MRSLPAHQFWPLLVAAIGLLNPLPLRAAEPEVNGVELFDSATQAIRSFDIYLTVTERLLNKPVEVGKGPDGQPIHTARPLEDGDALEVTVYRWRQVYSGGKCRYELLGADGKTLSIVVSNPESERRLSVDKRQGIVGARGLDHAVDGHDYMTFFRNAYGVIDFPRIFRQRGNAITRLATSGDTRTYTLDTAPTRIEDKMDFPSWGFQIEMDSHHGLMPARLDIYERRAGQTILSNRKVVNAFHKVSEDVWAPARVTVTSYFKKEEYVGKPMAEITAEVDLQKSRWNVDIADDTFTLPFPQGTQVWDRVRKVKYTTGEPDVGNNLDALIAGARDVMPASDPRELTPPDNTFWNPLRLWLTVTAGVLTVMMLLILYFRPRGQRSGNANDPRPA